MTPKSRKTLNGINVLYEDNHLLVVEKPYGVPSQGDITGDEDMLSACKKYIKQKYSKPGSVYLGLVHRLDRPTRGIMVFARTSKAAARLSKQIKSGDFKKTYFAVLTGSLAEEKGELWDYIEKDEKTRIARIIAAGGSGGQKKDGAPPAKRAGLKYEVLGEKEGLCLVRIDLLTGRFHQIRAQFASRGCAVYGDVKYGKSDVKDNLALFAAGLDFIHPVTREKMSFFIKPEHYPFNLFTFKDLHRGG